MQGLRSPSYQVCYKSKRLAAFICLQSQISWCGKRKLFHILTTYALPLFTFLFKVVLRVLLSARLSLVLVAPCWPQKDWFADVLTPLLAEPLKLPQLRSLLVQPHTWKLSSNSSERLAFCEELQRSSLQILRVPKQLSGRLSGPDSSIGVMDGISLHTRPLFSK